MKKRFLLVTLVLLFAMFLASCSSATELTAITFSGLTEETLDFQEEFNVLEGVTALGNDGVDYTDQIIYTSTSTISANHLLDTTSIGNHAIRYEVEVGTVKQQSWRYLIVSSPAPVEGEMLINPDFSEGLTGWNDPFVNYIADGAEMTLSVEDGVLQAIVVAGSNVWTPRFGQMNVPFEKDTTYEITFRAKSSVDKKINLQVGEVIDGSPYWDDFKPNQTEHRLITTEWATYSYQFTHVQDNKRGGILFEMGTIGGVGIDATLWFDDITIEETTAGPDVTAPIINGVRANITLEVDDAFDPLTGVTAVDNIDGTITDNIDVVIYEIDGLTETIVAEVDTTVEGEYRITYTVSDAAGNETVVESSVKVILILVENYPGWRTYIGGTAEGELVVADGVLSINLSVIPASLEGYQVQVIQDATSLYDMAENTGHMNLEHGKTYKVTFDAKASVAGDIKLAIGHAGGGWTAYHESAMTAITTNMATYTFEFTLDDAEKDYSVAAQFKIELGMLFNGQTAPQSFTLDNVKIEVKEGTDFIATDLIYNGTFELANPELLFEDSAWVGWYGDQWSGVTESETKIVNGELVVDVIYTGTPQAYATQIYQEGFAVENGKFYRITFDARADEAKTIMVAFGDALDNDPWFIEFVSKTTFNLTTSMQTFTLEFEMTEPTTADQGKLVFELATAINTKVYIDNVLFEEIDALAGNVVVDTNQVIDGTFED